MDIYQKITDKLIESLENGVKPWAKPWKNTSSGNSALPHNAVTGRNYNGINFLALCMSEYDSTAWLTFKQAKNLGGSVKKGEKATAIVFWNFGKNEDKDTGKQSTWAMAKSYNVFNVDQCEGLTLPKRRNIPTTEHSTVLELAESVGATVTHGSNRAAYYPSQDMITMPHQSQFTNCNHYSATLLHELTHWTAHASRLDRNLQGRFGSDSYAMEELVAEIGSAYLCALQGVDATTLQHDSYLASWLKVLKGDKKAIFTASSKARIAAEFITGETDHDQREAA